MNTLLENEDLISANLKNPVDLGDALKEAGMTFEVNFEDIAKSAQPDKLNYDPDELLNICNIDCLGVQDEDNYDSTPFEYLATKMEDLDREGFVKKRILREGHGDLPLERATVYIDYNAYIEHNDEPFDSTYARRRSHNFRLDSGETLMGLDIAVQSMKLNEKSQFLIKPQYAYGSMGCLTRVPPDSTVLFEVELKKFVNSGAIDLHEKLSLEKQAEFKETYKYALALCEKGNDLVKTYRNSKAAIKQYNMAVVKLENCRLKDYDEQMQQTKLLLRLYTNLAVCYVKEELPKKSCINCNNIYRMCKGTSLIVPTKVYFNNAKALIMLHDLEQAERRLRQAAQRNRDNPDIVKLFLTLNQLKEERTKKEDRLAKILLGLNSEVGDDFKKYIVDLCEELRDSTSVIQSELPAKLSNKEMEFAKEQARKFEFQFESYTDDGKQKHFITKKNETN